VAIGNLLGHQGLGYLRALAEGLRIEDAARRFLGISGGAVAIRHAHQGIVDEVRMLARRRGDPAWRLIGVELEVRTQSPVSTASIPSLEEWAASEGLDGWAASELLETYQSRFAIPVEDASAARRRARADRLRVRRLALLRQLEHAAAASPQPTDRLEGWIDPTLAGRLEKAGVVTLEDLQLRAASGARWWRAIPAVGDTKASAIAEQVGRLLLGSGAAGTATSTAPLVTVDWKRALEQSGKPSDSRLVATTHADPPSAAPLPSIDARDDRAAVMSWAAAKAGTALTLKQYRREGERVLLWARVEAHRSLAELTAEDCRGYLDFLQAIPNDWISKRKVAPHSPGWAPFAGQLSQVSRRLTVKIVFSMFQWLVEARYLPFNPWTLVNRKLGDQARPRTASSRAFTPATWATLLAELERPPTRLVTAPAIERLRWLCTVGEATGLRSAELLQAKRGDVEATRHGHILHVIGKGSKHRQVPLPKVALAACRSYFDSRGLDWDSATPETPLLSSLANPLQPLSYDALYETFTRFVRRALKSSDLPDDEKRQARNASGHWLRHTHATRFAERGGEIDVLQANLGHADPRTAANYYQAQLERRQKQLEKVFGTA
jgi:integrase